MTSVAAPAVAETVNGRRQPPVLAMFAVLWAIAAVFHVWVNPRALGVIEAPTFAGFTHLLVLGTAVLALFRPRSVLVLALLCGAVVVSAYAEAPFVGNHWVLSALVSLAFIGAAAGRGGADAVAARFVPAARATLLVFYAFAAFSKLNSGFFSVARSCAVFFFDQSADSWGVPIAAAGNGAMARIVIVGSVATELAIPVLLLMRRTRNLGVVVALAFHFLVALDRTHPFADFSAGLMAMFVLFLPPAFAEYAVRLARRVPRLLWWSLGAVAAVVTVALIARPSEMSLRVLDEGRDVMWYVIGVGVLVTVAVWIFGVRPAPSRRGVAVGMGWLAVVPALALLNGLSPYAELKTGFGWNMYANLVTAGGESNHFIVRQTLPITDEQRDLVTVLASSDAGLEWYADNGWRLPWPTFRSYVADHPEAAVRYERAGVVHDVARAADDPALVEPVPAWREKFQLFRAVDSLDPPRCQDVWGPAR